MFRVPGGDTSQWGHWGQRMVCSWQDGRDGAPLYPVFLTLHSLYLRESTESNHLGQCATAKCSHVNLKARTTTRTRPAGGVSGGSILPAESVRTSVGVPASTRTTRAVMSAAVAAYGSGGSAFLAVSRRG